LILLVCTSFSVPGKTMFRRTHVMRHFNCAYIYRVFFSSNKWTFSPSEFHKFLW
jgi:hypothetical protein